jgi:hypothetical protein
MSRFRNLSIAASLGVMAAVGLQSAPAQVGAAQPHVQQAVLAGALGYEGGAFPGHFHPTAGTVEVAQSNPPITLDEQVGPSGHFKIPLSPGSYTVVGCGPSSSGGQGLCGRPKHVTLSAGEVDHIRLIWAMVP